MTNPRTMGGFDISPRAALAAPTELFVIYVQGLAILVTSILSVLGAGWMIASFFAFSNLRSFRHQLILGLAISDCVMAFNFLLSSSMNVGSRWIGAPEQARFCSFNGYMTQVFVIQTDYWVLTIAVYTYIVLTDQKTWSSWLHEHPVLPWALPWVLSILWASIGLGVTGYGDIGSWCWFTSDEVRLLVNFVPRWIIIAIMFLMYARLYLVLFKAHRRLVSLDVSDSGGPSGSGSRHMEANSASRTRRLKRLARFMLLYPLAYAIIWSLPTGIRIYQTVSGQAAPWQLATVDKACIVLQGFVDAVIYGATEGSLASWRGLLFPGSQKRLSGVVVQARDNGYGDYDSKRKKGSSRWDSASAADAGQQELVSSSAASTAGAETGARFPSAESLRFAETGPTLADSTEGIELGSLGKGIRKTVKIEVVSAIGWNEQQGAPQRPEKTYFSSTERATFLEM